MRERGSLVSVGATATTGTIPTLLLGSSALPPGGPTPAPHHQPHSLPTAHPYSMRSPKSRFPARAVCHRSDGRHRHSQPRSLRRATIPDSGWGAH